jgi:acetyl-CoA C-acetyltransferase
MASDDNSAGGTGREARPVYLVDGARTPFLAARGEPGPFTPVDLAVQCGRPLLLRQPAAAKAIDQVILGCVNVLAEEANPARIAALRLGLGTAMPAFTVQINCGSGMQSIDTGRQLIENGRAELVLAGGAEALSHSPLLIPQPGVRWLAAVRKARSLRQRARALAGFRPGFLKPVIGLERGLTDPVVEMNMGQTAEKLAHLLAIPRSDADAYAVRSHRRLKQAQDAGWLDGEVVPAFARDGRVYQADNGVRPDTSVGQLAKLKPAFERPYGQVTAGNASQVTDGASWTLLASETALERHRLEPLALLRGSAWRALDPSIMGLAPVLCATALMQRHGLTMDAVDLWEINEAFAAQVLACLKVWDSETLCRDLLGTEGAVTAPAAERLNVDGGAISLGHPVGTSGNRILLHLARALERLGKQRGIATECIGGGQGGAMLVERP